MDQHEVMTRFNGDLSFTADIQEYQVTMDSSDPEGRHSGPNPKRLLLASLAGCTGIDVVSILNKMKVIFSDFTITVKAELTDVHPKVYSSFFITYSIKLSENDRAKMEKAVHLSKEKYCGVSAMFRAFATIDFTIVFL